MKFRAFLLAMLIIAGMVASGQRSTLELTFTAENNGVHVQLDSIRVMNNTQGGYTMLYWPDTVLSIYYVGISEIINDESAFRVFQNYPNPVADQTTVSLYVPGQDKVSLFITDILGRVILKSERMLDQGVHSFRFTPGSGSLYFFTAQWKGQSSSVKILQTGCNSNPICPLEYTGSETSSPLLKATEEVRDFVFSLGDELLCIGYADDLQSGFLDSPEEYRSYTFEFATNITCPGTPTVEYEGQMYNTIQVFSQCWLKENLNVGIMIPATQLAANNVIIEKYCYNYEPDSCAKYGGLYQWDEMMDYLFQPGTRGICPPDWHIPTDDEWKILEGTVDSQYGIDDPVWDFLGNFRGNDAGRNLKTTTGWYQGNNGTDSFNYSGMPAGYKHLTGYFYAAVGLFWWSSTQGSYSSALDRHLTYNKMGISRQDDGMGYGFSDRCLRD